MRNKIKKHHLFGPSSVVPVLWDASSLKNSHIIRAHYLVEQFQAIKKAGFFPKKFNEVILIGAGNGLSEIQALITALKEMRIKTPSVIHIVDPNPHKETLIKDGLEDKNILRKYPELTGPDAPKEIRVYPIKAKHIFHYINSNSIGFVTGFDTIQDDIMSPSEQELTALSVWLAMKPGGIFAFPGTFYNHNILKLIPGYQIAYNSQNDGLQHPIFIKSQKPSMLPDQPMQLPETDLYFLFQKSA